MNSVSITNHEWLSYCSLFYGVGRGGLSSLSGGNWLGALDWHVATYTRDGIMTWSNIITILQIELYSNITIGAIGGINGSDLKGSIFYLSDYIATRLPTLEMHF